MKRTFVVVLSAALLFGACNAKEGVEVSDAWARPAMPGMTSAVYLVIQNHNAEADELIGAVSDMAEAVEIHESKMEGDVMRMNRVESVVLEPSTKVEFMPGGYHIMLVGLKQELKPGDEIGITLQFRKTPDITLMVTVRDADGMQNLENHSP